MAPSAAVNSQEEPPAQQHAHNMVASEVGALLGWRLHTSKVNLALALALTSVAGGFLASLLPAVLLLAAVNGILGALLLCGGFRRLPRPVRWVGGVVCGLMLAALPYLATQCGGMLIAGIIFICLLALLNVGHALIVLCLFMSCACGAAGRLLGALLGGDGSNWPAGLEIFGGLAGLAANLFIFVFPGKLFSGRGREGAVAPDQSLADARSPETASEKTSALWLVLVVLAALVELFIPHNFWLIVWLESHYFWLIVWLALFALAALWPEELPGLWQVLVALAVLVAVWSKDFGRWTGLAGLAATLLVFVFLKILFPRVVLWTKNWPALVAQAALFGVLKKQYLRFKQWLALVAQMAFFKVLRKLFPRRELWPALVALAALVAVLCACWLIPLRLGFGEKASLYKCGFIGDEYYYADRCQPLVAGATATNPVNGICDPHAASQYYLEDSFRALLTFTGLDIAYFFWVWRFVFPVLFLGTIGLLVHECLPAGGVKRWRLWLAASAASFISVYAFYDLLTPCPALQGWLNRFCTNTEYPLAALLLWTFIRLLKECNPRNGLALAIMSAVITYERIYAAVPWSLGIFCGVLILLVLGRLTISTALVLLTALAVLMSLWTERYLQNRDLQVQAEIFARSNLYFEYWKGKTHPNEWLYLKFAAGFMAAGLLLGRRWWPLAGGGLATMAVLPYISGYFPFNLQLIQERYGVFYLLLAPVLALPVLGKYVNFNRVGRWTLVFSLLAVCGAAIVGFHNATFNFAEYLCGPYESVDEDLKHVKAYKWVRDNTPPDALFLVDDGYDWSGITNTGHTSRYVQDIQADVFQIVAKRRRVYQSLLRNNAILNNDYDAMWVLHTGTFGINWDKDNYLPKLRAWRPDYVLWRKDGAPVPRGWWGHLLAPPHSEKVYEDQATLIWKLPPGPFPF